VTQELRIDFPEVAPGDRPTVYPDADSALLLLEWTDLPAGAVVMISLNRPAQHNPIDRHTLRALRALVERLSLGDGPRAILLTGEGETFSAGGDLKGYQDLYRDPVAFREFMDDFDATCAALEASPAVVVAMINGTCVAGGTELALACDFITIADQARIGDGHLRFGQLPGAGGSQRLVRAIGVQRARNWLLTGDLFPAEVAVEAGLATFAVPRDQLRKRTLELVGRILERTPLGVRRMKELVRIAQNHSLDDSLALEASLVHTYATESFDATEGLNAFAERRPAQYRGV